MHVGVEFWPIVAYGVKRVRGLVRPGLGNAPHPCLRDLLSRGSTNPANRADDRSLERRVVPGR